MGAYCQSNEQAAPGGVHTHTHTHTQTHTETHTHSRVRTQISTTGDSISHRGGGTANKGWRDRKGGRERERERNGGSEGGKEGDREREGGWNINEGGQRKSTGCMCWCRDTMCERT